MTLTPSSPPRPEPVVSVDQLALRDEARVRSAMREGKRERLDHYPLGARGVRLLLVEKFRGVASLEDLLLHAGVRGVLPLRGANTEDVSEALYRDESGDPFAIPSVRRNSHDEQLWTLVSMSSLDDRIEGLRWQMARSARAREQRRQRVRLARALALVGACVDGEGEATP